MPKPKSTPKGRKPKNRYSTAINILPEWEEIISRFLKHKDEWRCRYCGALLAKEKILIGAVEIKCKKCKKINLISYDDMSRVVEIIKAALDEGK